MSTQEGNNDNAPRFEGVSMPWDEPVLATAGHIKIGGLGEKRQKKNGKGPNDTWQMPVKLNHFLVTKTTRGADGNLEQDLDLMSDLEHRWADSDGRIRQLPIVLHSDDLRDVFPSKLAYYNGKSLLCSGDGRDATRHKIDRETGKRTGSYSVQCPCKHSSLVNEEGKCKPHATLHCSIRVDGRGLFGSVYRWRTTSAISIRRMMGSLQQVQNVVGSLRGVPLVLVVSEVQLAGKAPVYVCHVELREQSLSDAQRDVLAMSRQREAVALAAARQPVRLTVLQPGGDHEDDDEQASVAAEFHTDAEFNEQPSDRPPSLLAHASKAP